MSNVLSEDKKQQVLALGRLGWSLRRIEQATGVRRETAGGYLKAAGFGVRPPGKWGRQPAEKAKPANEVITDPAKPANEVITDFGVGFSGVKARKRITVSACEPFRDRIERAHLEGRNAMGIWQDLVTEQGFSSGYQSVRRFLYHLHGSTAPEARAVIVTAQEKRDRSTTAVDRWSGMRARASTVARACSC